MGKGSSSKSKSYSGSGQKWATPIARAAAGQVEGVFNQAQPGLNKLTDIAQNTLAPAMVSKFQNSLGGANAAQGYNMDVVNGKFMSGNPFLENIIGQARGGIMDSVNGNFSLAGRYGSGAHTGMLAKELGNMESGLRYQNYTTEAARRDAAAQALAGQASADGGMALGSLGIGAELPYTGSNSMANALGALFAGGTETTKTKQGGGGLLGGIGSLMSGIGAMGSGGIFSDRRLKKNIEKVGEYDNGLGKYRWVYKNDPTNTVYEGVMADEVKAKRPEAYSESRDGYGVVNYAELGLAMKEVA